MTSSSLSHRRIVLALLLCLGLSLGWSRIGHAEDTELRKMRQTAAYLSILHKRIQERWQIKKLSWAKLRLLSATVTIWINAKGGLVNMKFQRASGSKHFDASLVRAVQRSSPFPKPPALLRKTARFSGLEIYFRKRVFKRSKVPLKLRFRSTAVAPKWRATPKKRKPAPRK